MIYTIIRDKWLRGEGEDASLLLRKRDGKMCCLGQVLLQSGAEDGDIIGCANPNSSARLIELSLPLGLLHGNSHDCSVSCSSMMTTNDSEDISDSEREHLLKIEASKLGHSLIFV